MRPILLSGKSQSGKSTAVSFITKELGEKRVKEYFFAKPLKDFLINVLGLGYLQCYGSNVDKNTYTQIYWESFSEEIRTKYKKIRGKMTAREVMEVFGTDICRRLNNSCWALACRREMEFDKIVPFPIISDVRFPDEIEVFADMNPIIIRFLRNPLDRRSEADCSLDSYDFSNYHIIDNTNMTIQEKNCKIAEILHKEIFTNQI